MRFGENSKRELIPFLLPLPPSRRLSENIYSHKPTLGVSIFPLRTSRKQKRLESSSSIDSMQIDQPDEIPLHLHLLFHHRRHS